MKIPAKNENNELVNRNQAFLIYQDDNGIARVNVRFEGEDVWLTQEQMMDLFDASQQDVSYHEGRTIYVVMPPRPCLSGFRRFCIAGHAKRLVCEMP